MEQRPDSDLDRERRRTPRTPTPDYPRTEEEPVGVYSRPGQTTSGSSAGRAIAVILALVVLALLAFLLIQFVL